MKKNVVLAVLLGAFLCAVQSQVFAGPEMVRASFRLLIGHIESAGPSTASFTLQPGAESGSLELLPAAESLEKLLNNLKTSYRLSWIEEAGYSDARLTVGDEKKVIDNIAGYSVFVTLNTADDGRVVFKTKVMYGDTVVSQPNIFQEKGSLASVGWRNGETAPYMFLVIYSGTGGMPLTASNAEQQAVGLSDEQGVPKIIKRVSPKYPEEARTAGLQGSVIVNCEIGPDGKVKDVSVEKGEDQSLNDSAVAAVRQWEFEPPIIDGEPATVRATFTLIFRLD